MGFVDDDHGPSVSFGGFGCEETGGLGHDFGFVESGVGAQRGHDGDVEASGAERGVWNVEDVVAGRVEGCDGGANGDGFAGAGSS